MNFFQHQATARKNTLRLLGLFVCAVAAVVGMWAMALSLFGHYYLTDTIPHLVLPTSIGLLLLVALASLYRMAVLAQGGQVVAQELGGREITQPSNDFYIRRLQNVVEEIAIASGMPIPKIFVLENEHGINAFAAGFTPNNAVIAVTHGALTKLNRSELQGLVAHEFSHILNGDMRLNIILVGVVFGLLFLSLTGSKMLELLSKGRNQNNSVIIVPLVLIGLGSVGTFLGRLIKASISRQREYLADASAVQFTRQTDGIAGALKKAAGLHDSLLDTKSWRDEFSHFFFNTKSSSKWWKGSFATHPPILQRIQRLDPNFTSQSLLRAKVRWDKTPPDGMVEDLRMGLVPVGVTPAPVHGPQDIAQKIANPFPLNYQRAQRILRKLPEDLASHIRHKETVGAVIYALFIDAAALEQQYANRAYLESHLSKKAYDAVEHATLLVNSLPPHHRLQVLQLCLPALRQCSEEAWNELSKNLEAFIHMGDHVTIGEYCMAKMIGFSIEEWCQPSQADKNLKKLHHGKNEVVRLLAAVAYYGHAQFPQAQQAFLNGTRKAFPMDTFVYKPPIDGVASLDDIWTTVRSFNPLSKQAVVEAVVETICSDGEIQSDEEDFLRVVCAALNCPVPLMS